MAELTKEQTAHTKGIAILMMVCLHLFNQPHEGLFEPLLFVGKAPLSYYVSLFCDCCVAIYCFCSGYGLFANFAKSQDGYSAKNYLRIAKLYLNFWVVLLLFAVLLGSVLGAEGYPGSFLKFFLNFATLSKSYNGAWWFLFSYLLLVLTSPVLFRMQQRFSPWLLIPTLLILYSAGYVQRIFAPVQSGSEIPDWLLNQLALYGNCLLPFMAGSLFRAHGVFGRINLWSQNWKFRGVMAMAGIVLLAVAHAFVPTLYVAVFTGIAFIVLFNLIDLPELFSRTLSFLGEHSTNIWLLHMFLIISFFKPEMYLPQNPTLIFIWVMLWCIGCSFIVQFIYDKLQKALISLIGKP